MATKWTTVSMATACGHVARRKGPGGLRCLALAKPGSLYCPVHDAFPPIRSGAPVPARRDPDADVLPLQADDQVIFKEAETQRAGRGARRGRSVRAAP